MVLRRKNLLLLAAALAATCLMALACVQTARADSPGAPSTNIIGGDPIASDASYPFLTAILRNTDIAGVTPEEIAKFTLSRLTGSKADCAFLSCTNFRALDALPALRSRLNMPIVTSNDAALKGALKALGLSDAKQL